jgi:plasmid stabilization system protein ParE
MVKRIIWTNRAVSVFQKILEYYYLRNGTKTYSSNLNKEIKDLVSLLSKHPFLGRKTEMEHLRVLIKGDYKIFYRIEKKEIIILLIWDCRQNPGSLKL